MGLRLSAAKTRIVSVDQGFDFLGFRIQRQPKRGSGKPTVYTFPTKTALASVKAKVQAATRQGRNQPFATLLHRLAPVLRGWTSYFRHGVSKASFDYLRRFTWRRVLLWLRRKHRPVRWRYLRRRYLPGWWPTDGTVSLFDPAKVTVRPSTCCWRSGLAPSRPGKEDGGVLRAERALLGGPRSASRTPGPGERS